MVTTSCVLNTPRCVTTVPRVHLHGSQGPGRCLRWSPIPPGTPVTPRIYLYIYLNNRSFTSMQMCHTHTQHCQTQFCHTVSHTTP